MMHFSRSRRVAWLFPPSRLSGCIPGLDRKRFACRGKKSRPRNCLCTIPSLADDSVGCNVLFCVMDVFSTCNEHPAEGAGEEEEEQVEEEKDHREKEEGKRGEGKAGGIGN